MIKYTVRTVAGYFKLECDLRDFEEALRIVRKRSSEVDSSKDEPKIKLSDGLKQKMETRRVL